MKVDASGGDRIQSPSFVGTSPDIDPLLVVVDQHDLRERLDLLVVRQLLSAIVVRRRRTQYLDNQTRIGHGLLLAILAVELGLAADHRYIRIGAEPGGEHADPQIGTIYPTGTPSQAGVQQSRDVDRYRGMIGGTAGHRPYLARQEFMFHWAYLF